jgi:hypothetical protein
MSSGKAINRGFERRTEMRRESFNGGQAKSAMGLTLEFVNRHDQFRRTQMTEEFKFIAFS